MITVIVPWRGGCPHREAAWRWVKARWEAVWPDWTLVQADARSTAWCKAAAVTPAVERAQTEVVVVADADVWCDGVEAAIAAVDGGAPWAIPHELVYRLREHATAALRAGELALADVQRLGPRDLARPSYIGVKGGGIVVAHRETLIDIPLDSRFESWGQEDESWAMALSTLAGSPWRGTAPLVHLWHPPQERLDHRRGSLEGWRLRRRYAAARSNPVRMRALIEEVPCPSPS